MENFPLLMIIAGIICGGIYGDVRTPEEADSITVAKFIGGYALLWGTVIGLAVFVTLQMF